MLQEILNACEETLLIVCLAMILVCTINLPISILLAMSRHAKNQWFRKCHTLLQIIFSFMASTSLFWLIIALIPLKHFTTTKEISLYNALIPLSLTATPLFLQLLSQAFEQPMQLRETFFLYGLNQWQFITKILLPEAYPKLLKSITILFTHLFGYAIIVGFLGKGGLGDLLFEKGFKELDTHYLGWIVFVCVLIIQIFSILGRYTIYLRKKSANAYL